MDLSGMVWLDTRDCDGGVDDGTHVASPLLITLYSLAHLTLATTQRWVHIILFYWRDNQGAERRQILLQTLFSWHVNCLPHLDSNLGGKREPPDHPVLTQFSFSLGLLQPCCGSSGFSGTRPLHLLAHLPCSCLLHFTRLAFIILQVLAQTVPSQRGPSWLLEQNRFQPTASGS